MPITILFPDRGIIILSSRKSLAKMNLNITSWDVQIHCRFRPIDWVHVLSLPKLFPLLNFQERKGVPIILIIKSLAKSVLDVKNVRWNLIISKSNRRRFPWPQCARTNMIRRRGERPRIIVAIGLIWRPLLKEQRFRRVIVLFFCGCAVLHYLLVSVGRGSFMSH